MRTIYFLHLVIFLQIKDYQKPNFYGFFLGFGLIFDQLQYTNLKNAIMNSYANPSCSDRGPDYLFILKICSKSVKSDTILESSLLESLYALVQSPKTHLNSLLVILDQQFAKKLQIENFFTLQNPQVSSEQIKATKIKLSLNKDLPKKIKTNPPKKKN